MLSFRLASLALSGCAAAFVLAGCGSVTHNMAGTGAAPTVANTGIQVNGVAPNRALYVQFNEAMDASTITTQSFLIKNSAGTAAAGVVTYNPNFNIASFQPNPALQTDASYTLTVTTAVASSQGVHLQSAYTSSFTTRADTDHSPIYVKAVTPSPGATCVSTSTPITITFNEGADINTLTSANIMVTGPGGTMIAVKMGYDAGSGMVTLTPTAALPSGDITVTVQNVADAAGVAMGSKYAWSFSTVCSGGGGGGTPGTVQFQAPFFSDHIVGKVSIDTLGNVTAQLNSATPSATYTLQFCPASNPLKSNYQTTCVDILKLSTDASGNGTATAKFPNSGNWAGDFSLVDASGKYAYSTDTRPNVVNETYQAKLLPETTTNMGDDTNKPGQDPLASGSVTYSNGMLTATVNGAAPNRTYSVDESETIYINSSGTYQLTTFTTDAAGNGSATAQLETTGGDMFTLDINSGTQSGFIAGFTIP